MSSLRVRIGATLLATCLTSAGFASAAEASAPVRVLAAHHACTRTASHKCIRGGETCPKAKYKKSGYDAEGRRYVCKGNRSHPHWEKP